MNDANESDTFNLKFSPLIGIGVRLSVYLQALLFITAEIIIITPAYLTQLRTKAVLKGIPGALHVIFENGISNQVTSVALLISAIIQARSFYLSMYHALIVLNLSWILTLSMFFSPFTLKLYKGEKREYLQTKARVISLIALFGGVLKGAFGFWVTVSPGSFHATSSAGMACDLQNAVEFFMFGKNFNTSAPFFRYFWMATYASALVVYTPTLLLFSYGVFRTIIVMTPGNQFAPPGNSDPRFGSMVELGTGHKVFAAGVIITALATFLFKFIVFLSLLLSAAVTLSMVQDEMPVAWRWLVGRPLRLMKMLLKLMERPLRLIGSWVTVLWEPWFLYFSGLLLPAGSVIGFIISTELTIKANAGLVSSGENQWSLGQTLAVLLVLPNAYMVFKCAWVIVKAFREQGSRDTSPGTVEEGIIDEMSQHRRTRAISSGTGEEGCRDGMPQCRRTWPASSGTGEERRVDGMLQYSNDPYVPQWSDSHSTRLYRGHGATNIHHHHPHDPYVRGGRVRGGRYRSERL